MHIHGIYTDFTDTDTTHTHIDRRSDATKTISVVDSEQFNASRLYTSVYCKHCIKQAGITPNDP